MSANIVDLASRRPGAAIIIHPGPRGFTVTLDPPADRPGIASHSQFVTHRAARTHALALLDLLPGRRIFDRTGGELQLPGGGDSAA